MKSILFIINLLFASVCLAQSQIGAAKDYVECGKEEASISLSMVCSLDRVGNDTKRVFYFRAPKPNTGYGNSSGSGSIHHVDGMDLTYTISTTVETGTTAVGVTIIASWQSEVARGKSEMTVSVPYLKEIKGQQAGFNYSFTWKKLK